MDFKMRLGLFSMVWRACFTVLSSSLVARASLTEFNLSQYVSLDLADKSGEGGLLDKLWLDLEWKIERHTSLDFGPKLSIDAPADTLTQIRLNEDTTNNKTALLSFLYCGRTEPGHGPGHASKASRCCFANGASVLVSCVCALWMCAASNSQLSKLFLCCALIAVVGLQGAWSCGGKITLTLHISGDQWASIGGCGYCLKEDAMRTKHFEWRPRCNVTAARSALDAAAVGCGFNATTSSNSNLCPEGGQGVPTVQGGCGPNGWCAYTTQGNCMIPETIANTCIHNTLEEVVRPSNSSSSMDVAFLKIMFACARRQTPVEGRPYTTDNGSVLASATWNGDSCTWSMSENAQKQTQQEAPTTLSEGDASIAAEAWLAHGREEHASIASFSRFSLDLLKFSSPPNLIEAAHLAAVDEVRHAKLAFDLATHFRQQTVLGSGAAHIEVGEFPASTVILAGTLAELATRSFREGCMGESNAVARLALATEAQVQGSPSYPVLKTLLEDEARHAALAWATVKWALVHGAELELALGDGQLRNVTSVAVSAGVLLTWAGRVAEETAANLEAVAMNLWVAPWLHELMKNPRAPALPPVLGYEQHGALGQAVARSSRLVLEELSKFSGAVVV